MHNIIRLFTEKQLFQGTVFDLADHQLHYIIHVMRAKLNDQLRFFNGLDGEWLGQISFISKKQVTITILEKLRDQSTNLPLELIFAPIKPARLSNLIEKATELGISKFTPIMTEYTNNRHLNLEKLQLIAIEAAEQSESLHITQFSEMISLDKFCQNHSNHSPVLFCNEHGESKHIYQALTALDKNSSYGIMIGPEGGFSIAEKDKLCSLEFIIPVSLGPRILRSETAAIAATSCLQAIIGDWFKQPRENG